MSTKHPNISTRGQFHQHFMSRFYTCSEPKSAAKTDNLNAFFTLLGSACVKAACKGLVKLTPDFHPFVHFAKVQAVLSVTSY
jgi:hypothetical protein